MSIKLTERPFLDQLKGLPRLYVDGELADHTIGDAYEGRLQIHGNIGACQAAQVDGDVLPAGAQVYVDQTTMEVVVEWPAYNVSSDTLANPGFESGNVGGWAFEFVGGTGAPVVDSQYKFAGNHSLRWPETRGLGDAQRVELISVNNALGLVIPGQHVSASVRMMYNPLRQGFDNGDIIFRGQAYLRWYDVGGNYLSTTAGTVERGNHRVYGNWLSIPVSGYTPAGGRGVRLAARQVCRRTDSWMDSAQWNIPTSVGANEERDYYVVLRVRDSAGRLAYWRGYISTAAIWFTSTPYPYFGQESLGYAVMVTGMGQREVIIERDAPSDLANYGASIFGFSIVEQPPPEPVERVAYTAAISAFQIRETPQADKNAERNNYTATINAFQIREQPNNSPESKTNYTATIAGFSIT